ncbi:MAG: hypothetical protein ACLGHZ_01890 [Actinomycetes bacterium]
MKPRTDVVALVVGLLACAIAGLGLWEAFGTLSWSAVTVAVPILLVAVGVVGLWASRQRS